MEKKFSVGDVLKIQANYSGGVEMAPDGFAVKDKLVYEVEVKRVLKTGIVLTDTNASGEERAAPITTQEE